MSREFRGCGRVCASRACAGRAKRLRDSLLEPSVRRREREETRTSPVFFQVMPVLKLRFARVVGPLAFTATFAVLAACGSNSDTTNGFTDDAGVTEDASIADSTVPPCRQPSFSTTGRFREFWEKRSAAPPTRTWGALSM